MEPNTYVRFECGRDGIVGPRFGPYDFVQITYNVIRASLNGEETELAEYDDGDWMLLPYMGVESIFSDVIVWGQ